MVVWLVVSKREEEKHSHKTNRGLVEGASERCSDLVKSLHGEVDAAAGRRQRQVLL